MLIRYVGAKEVKRDTINDPQTPYVWEASNGYVVDVKPEHVERLLKHPDVWAVEAPPKDEAPGKSVPLKGQAATSGK